MKIYCVVDTGLGTLMLKSKQCFKEKNKALSVMDYINKNHKAFDVKVVEERVSNG